MEMSKRIQWFLLSAAAMLCVLSIRIISVEATAPGQAAIPGMKTVTTVTTALGQSPDSHWLPVPSPVTDTLHALALSDNGEGWAVGAAGTILHLRQGEWYHSASPVTTDLYDVVVQSDGTGWAVGAYGTFLHLDDSVWTLAERFQPEDTFYGVDVVAATDPADGTAVAVGTSRYFNGGNPVERALVAKLLYDEWFTPPMVPPLTGELRGVSSSGAGTFTAVGAPVSGNRPKGLFYRQQCLFGTCGATVTDAEGGALNAIDQDVSENGAAVGAFLSVVPMRRGGMGQAAGVTADPSELLGVSAVRPGEFWAVGQHGMVLHSIRDMASLIKPTNGVDLHDVVVLPDGTGWAVGAGGTILRYRSNASDRTRAYLPRVGGRRE